MNIREIAEIIDNLWDLYFLYKNEEEKFDWDGGVIGYAEYLKEQTEYMMLMMANRLLDTEFTLEELQEEKKKMFKEDCLKFLECSKAQIPFLKTMIKGISPGKMSWNKTSIIFEDISKKNKEDA